MNKEKLNGKLGDYYTIDKYEERETETGSIEKTRIDCSQIHYYKEKTDTEKGEATESNILFTKQINNNRSGDTKQLRVDLI